MCADKAAAKARERVMRVSKQSALRDDTARYDHDMNALDAYGREASRRNRHNGAIEIDAP